jgi:hypothetical protein
MGCLTAEMLDMTLVPLFTRSTLAVSASLVLQRQEAFRGSLPSAKYFTVSVKDLSKPQKLDVRFDLPGTPLFLGTGQIVISKTRGWSNEA